MDVLGDGFAGQADRNEPFDTGVQPFAVEAAPIRGGRDEIFDFHLLELAGTEDEIARGDLVAECFADLGNAEGEFHAAGIDDVFVIGKDSLRGLGAEVSGGRIVCEGTDLGFKHEFEFARFGKGAGLGGLGADGLGALGFGALGEFPGLICEGGFVDRRGFVAGAVTNFLCELEAFRGVRAFHEGDETGGVSIEQDRRVEELVGAVTAFGFTAIHHGIREAIDVAGSLPNARVHNDAGIETDNVIALLDKMAPPGLLDVVAEFNAEGAVIEKSVIAAVNFGRWEDEPASFAKTDEFFHKGSIGSSWSVHRRLKEASRAGTVKIRLQGRVEYSSWRS